MTQEQVNEMLKSYKYAVGRCGHLKTELDMLARQIKVAQNDRAADLAAIKPQQITDMPHGTQVGNPTEKFGLMLASGWEPEHITELKARHIQLTAELHNCELVVNFVDSWLEGLTERESWIIQQQVIEARFWKDVQMDYRREFDDVCSKDTLKRLRARAMEKIYKMAE